MRVARLAVPFAALLLLGACDYFGTPTTDSEADASGEVLPGSVSDAMIPTDDLTSQPPSLGIQPGEGGTAADGGDAEATADSAAAEPPAEEAAPVEPEAAAE
jgi:hypothetical protein